MKRIFDFLQQGPSVVALALLFGGVFEYTRILGMWFTWTILIASTIVGILVLWYLKSSWDVPRPGYLISVGAASLMGCLSSFFLLLGVSDLISEADWRYYSLFVFWGGTIGICIGLLIHVLHTMPIEIAKKGSGKPK